jgi:predicted Na+-dependent transporter
MLDTVLTTITQVAMLTFVVGSMAAVGLALTVDRIVGPLRDLRLVAFLLLANFVAVPAVAIAAARLLPMDEAAGTATILIGCCAGAPFLPKLAQLARGDVALAVGGMVLLMVVTVGYAPIVVPLAVEGASVDPGEIASSLVLFMLVPLAIGLFVRGRYPALADEWVGTAGQIGNTALLLGIGAALLLTWRDILGSIGSWIFIGTAIVLAAGLLAGYVAGLGRPSGDQTVIALGSAQRNIAAAIVVATSLSSDVIVMTLVGALVIPIVLIVLAGELGKRSPGAGTTEEVPA